MIKNLVGRATDHVAGVVAPFAAVDTAVRDYRTDCLAQLQIPIPMPRDVQILAFGKVIQYLGAPVFGAFVTVAEYATTGEAPVRLPILATAAGLALGGIVRNRSR